MLHLPFRSHGLWLNQKYKPEVTACHAQPMSISNTCVVTSRSDSSLPGAPIKLMPTGQPSLVRIGRVTSGSPARLAMEVTEISLRLNCSNSACGVFLKGAGPGIDRRAELSVFAVQTVRHFVHVCHADELCTALQHPLHSLGVFLRRFVRVAPFGRSEGRPPSFHSEQVLRHERQAVEGSFSTSLDAHTRRKERTATVHGGAHVRAKDGGCVPRPTQPCTRTHHSSQSGAISKTKPGERRAGGEKDLCETGCELETAAATRGHSKAQPSNGCLKKHETFLRSMRH
mmetsp:Transcript_9917/g.60530  ORF Transcript_9917/g.60530 Transcript_9917/m.60530 type:complete len:285 (+) Transcript_9917:1587-2441(+)